jgi:tol-pal system protein YbgF
MNISGGGLRRRTPPLPYFCPVEPVEKSGRISVKSPMFARTRHTLSRLLFPVVFLAFGALGSGTVAAQAPLDIRVLNERIDALERRLQGLSQGGVPIQMPASPSETGTLNGDAQLPADVASRLQVRVLQLERLVERLTGQTEQNQFQIQQMQAQLQQLSADVSNRLTVLEQAVGVSAAVAMPAGRVLPPVSGSMQPVPNASGTATSAPQMGQFDGNSRVEPDMNMPMSMPVQTQPQAIAVASPGGGSEQVTPPVAGTAPLAPGPVNQGNTFGVLRVDEAGAALPPAPGSAAAPAAPQTPTLPAAPPNVAAAPSPGPVATQRIGIASSPALELTALPVGTPQEQYDYAFDILRRADYARAEKALRLFLEQNGTDELAGNAQYWLGETFYVRGDFEQAAVEFLSGYQTYPASSKAPDNLLKLGLSMARLGQTDGACTALSRLATEYPSANDTIRRRAQTERSRLNCS